MPRKKVIKSRFYVLQWPDGTYYCTTSSSGWDAIDSTDDPMRAERFATLRWARSFHDSRGHFFHQEMKAVPIHTRALVHAGIVLKARERSSADNDDRS